VIFDVIDTALRDFSPRRPRRPLISQDELLFGPTVIDRPVYIPEPPPRRGPRR